MYGDPSVHRFANGLLALVFFALGAGLLLGGADFPEAFEVGVGVVCLGAWGLLGVLVPRAGLTNVVGFVLVSDVVDVVFE